MFHGIFPSILAISMQLVIIIINIIIVIIIRRVCDAAGSISLAA